MIENSFGLFFFLKQPKNQKSDERYVYLRITVDGTAKEISTKRIWNVSKWDQRTGRAKVHIKIRRAFPLGIQEAFKIKVKFNRAYIGNP